jgi:hypothetical protein
MAAHKGPATLRPRCTRSGSSVAAIPVYHCVTFDMVGIVLFHMRYMSVFDVRKSAVFDIMGHACSTI